MVPFKQLIIYYFSGTGNARHVAGWISEVAEERHLPATVYDISKIDRKLIPPPPPDSIIGFCSPTHGFNFPPVMMNFIFRFPRSQDNRVFLVNTRAGMKLFGIFLPGLSGVALLLSAVALLFKGYRITGMRPVDLPSNWISLHPGLRQKAIESMFIKWKAITQRFATTILSGKKDYKALMALPVDLLIGPVSVLYYFFGRFIFAKSFYASKACNNCGLCIRQCPVKAISLVDNRPFWSYRCESCMHCMNTCPETAIETAHGFVIGLLILISVIMQSFVYIWLSDHHIGWFSKPGIGGSFMRSVFETIVAFFALIISYRLVHYLRRMRVFDMLIRYTSLTSYAFWGRYRPGKMFKK